MLERLSSENEGKKPRGKNILQQTKQKTGTKQIKKRTKKEKIQSKLP